MEYISSSQWRHWPIAHESCVVINRAIRVLCTSLFWSIGTSQPD